MAFFCFNGDIINHIFTISNLDMLFKLEKCRLWQNFIIIVIYPSDLQKNIGGVILNSNYQTILLLAFKDNKILLSG